jgi:hypothetical protein
MHSRTRILLVGLLAALAFSAAVATAQARRLELSNQTFRVVWDPIHRLTFLEEGELVSVACGVTLGPRRRIRCRGTSVTKDLKEAYPT